MACKRNRIIDLIEYIESCGVQVNIGKNKAQGNKGFFKVINGTFRIDISKGLSDDVVIRTLVHEFSHYLHYINDKTLKSLEFFAGENWDILIEELIELTVEAIPKASIAPLFEAKDKTLIDIKLLETHLLEINPNYFEEKNTKRLEKELEKAGYLPLLKYDRVKILGLLGYKLITIDNVINISHEAELYLKMKSKERYLKRINSRISRLNKYYNSPTELFARAMEMYVFNRDKVFQKAPEFFSIVERVVVTKKIPELNRLLQILILN